MTNHSNIIASKTPRTTTTKKTHEQYEKAKKDMTPGDEPPRSESVQYATEKERRNSSRKNKEDGPNGNGTKSWICLRVKIKSDAVKNTA